VEGTCKKRLSLCFPTLSQAPERARRPGRWQEAAQRITGSDWTSGIAEAGHSASSRRLAEGRREL